MLSIVRESDTIARLGGDEFSVILYDIGQILAEKIASKLVEGIISSCVDVEGHKLQVGVSIGISMFPENGTDSDLLLQRADIAMYNAKNNGLKITCYHPDMDANNYENLMLSHDLKAGIDQHQFIALFQLKYDLASQEPCGCEILLRWDHPVLGRLTPDKFIHIAEQENIIGDLTEWIIREYLPKFNRIIDIYPDFHISVNVSPYDLMDFTLFDKFERAINEFSLPQENIVIEVTENAIMKNPIRSAAILNKFSARNISVSIDDFGTGYSSLAYLQRFPISELKIDKSFLQDIDLLSNNYPIVNATITMSHDLGIKVVAEGVENEKTHQLLVDLGCDRVQGYYYARPVSFEDLEEMLLSDRA